MTIRGKWAWSTVAVLVLSLGLNIFALGAVAAWRHFGPDRFGGIERPMDRETAEAARPYLRAAFRAHRDDIRAAGRAVADARSSAAEMLKAASLDEAALARELGALSDATVAAQVAFQQVLVEAARAMPDDLRQRVDWRFIGHRARGAMGHGGHGDPEDGPPPRP
ncbi:MAG: periplasmic heavy metal sensor [Rhodobiaceae bacterium]|nr:periplasmic heavy metal sensor [Rhodobiaceae bacterium]MCC0041083.1 periplasmic heavy metal sensor [Rhodobiaceae bacterium]